MVLGCCSEWVHFTLPTTMSPWHRFVVVGSVQTRSLSSQYLSWGGSGAALWSLDNFFKNLIYLFIYFWLCYVLCVHGSGDAARAHVWGSRGSRDNCVIPAPDSFRFLDLQGSDRPMLPLATLWCQGFLWSLRMCAFHWLGLPLSQELGQGCFFSSHHPG